MWRSDFALIINYRADSGANVEKASYECRAKPLSYRHISFIFNNFMEQMCKMPAISTYAFCMKQKRHSAKKCVRFEIAIIGNLKKIIPNTSNFIHYSKSPPSTQYSREDRKITFP